MDHRSNNYPYSRRSKPFRNYAEDDDDDDVVLAGEDDDISGEDDDDDAADEDYTAGVHHRQKHRRLDTGNYQFAPRLDAGIDWSEKGTFVLLDIWGERFLQLGRSSLRNEDWNDVVERVSEVTRAKLSVLDCRNRLNALKTRYKKEKMKLGGASMTGNNNSKWVYFKKMDSLMTMSPRQLQQQEQCGLACGVDSGEFVFMNPRVYLDHSNALDEMRDSPGNSESNEDEEDNDEDDKEEDEEEEESYRMLSESIKRVGEIYEKIEDSKRQHMMELERMRAEFQRDLELQKKEIIDRTRSEISKLSQGDDAHDSECSAENVE